MSSIDGVELCRTRRTPFVDFKFGRPSLIPPFICYISFYLLQIYQTSIQLRPYWNPYVWIPNFLTRISDFELSDMFPKNEITPPFLCVTNLYGLSFSNVLTDILSELLNLSMSTCICIYVRIRVTFLISYPLFIPKHEQ